MSAVLKETDHELEYPRENKKEKKKYKFNLIKRWGVTIVQTTDPEKDMNVC